MNVLHIIPSWEVGGAETFVLHLSAALKSTGVTAKVMAWRDVGSLEKKFRAAGVETINLNGKSRFDGYVAWRLTRILNESDFDVVHAHLFPLHWWIAFLPLRSDLATAYTEHSVTNGRRHMPSMRRIEKHVYQRIDTLIAVSEEVKSSLTKWQPKLKSVHTIHNGVPAIPLTDRRQTLAVGRLLFVGRLTHVKGVDLLFNACDLLRRQGIDFFLDVVGDGPERSRLECQAMELGLSSRVNFHGVREDPLEFFSRRPIVVQPSRWEGLPMVTLEAMRSRCPIVAARVGGIPGVLTHGVSAFLVDAEDHTQLANAIWTLVREERLAESLSEAAHTEFLRYYEISRAAAMHRDVYRDLIDTVRLSA